jgi:hypothetical protein
VTIDFDDLPPLTEQCDCWGGERPITKCSKVLVKCVRCKNGIRPSKFGIAVLNLLKDYGNIDEKITAAHRPCSCERFIGKSPTI